MPERSPTHDVPFTAADAMKFWKVHKSTIWTWIKRAGIKPCGQLDTPGKPYTYRFGELAEAERKFRTSGRGRPRADYPT